MEITENTEPILCNTKNCNFIPVKYRYLAVASCQQCKMSMCADCLRAHNRSRLTRKHCVGDIVDGVLLLFSIVEKTPKADMALPAIKVELENNPSQSSDDEDVDELWTGEEAQKDVVDDLYHCPMCPFTSVRRTLLYKHIRLHTRERPFKCPECTYSARCDSTLQKHIKRQHEVCPFECTKCPYTARTSKTLVIHERRHGCDAPIKCTECDFAVRTDRQFMGHALTHNGETPFFKCSQCDIGMRTEHALIEHVEKEHGRTTVENVKNEPIEMEDSEGECTLGDHEPTACTSAITTTKEEPMETSECTCETEPNFTMTGNLVVNVGLPVVDCADIVHGTTTDTGNLDQTVETLEKDDDSYFIYPLCSFCARSALRVKLHMNVHTEGSQVQPERVSVCGNRSVENAQNWKMLE